MSSTSFPPEVLSHILSFLAPYPPPFYFDRDVSPELVKESREKRKLFHSLCLVARSFRDFVQPLMFKSPRFLAPTEEQRFFESLVLKEKNEDFKVRDLYLDLDPFLDRSQPLQPQNPTLAGHIFQDRYETLDLILARVIPDLLSLRLDALNNRYVRSIMDRLSYQAPPEGGKLTSIALSGDPYTISFAYLANRFHRDFFRHLKEIKLADVKVPEDWNWDVEVGKGIRPKYKLQRFEVWGGKWESQRPGGGMWEGGDALEGLLGLDLKEEENKKAENPNEIQEPTSLRHLVLFECFYTLSPVLPVASHFRSSLKSLSLKPIPSQSPTFSSLGILLSLSPHLFQFTSLQLLVIHFMDFPKKAFTSEEEGAVFPAEVLKRLKMLKVIVQSTHNMPCKEYLWTQMERWKKLMGDGGRVRYEVGYEWKPKLSEDIL
jgi:hypothetical protein